MDRAGGARPSSVHQEAPNWFFLDFVKLHILPFSSTNILIHGQILKIKYV